MSDVPLVSICIPTYNRAAMIGKAIESALGQTYTNLEVIVVDNASSDNTPAVVASYRDERLRYVRNEKNLGLFGNFNRCIELAQGKYLHILHSDDYIDSDFTRRCVAFFYEHPTAVMTSTRACAVRNNIVTEDVGGISDFIYTAPEGFRRLLADRSYISCPSVMVLREVYREVGSFSLEYPYSSDFYQWLRIARNYDIGFVSGACVYYLEGEHSESFRFLFASPQGYLDMLRMFIQLQCDLGQDFREYTAEFLAAEWRYIQDCLYAGFTRGDSMTGFSPRIFCSLAYACWSLETPVTAVQWLGTIRDRVIIFFAGLLMAWSPVRKVVNHLFFGHGKGY
jgi:glycosyltransferase involved in cell wall biosynthesis